MKAENLIKLKNNGLNVPEFIIVNENDKDILSKVESFLPGKRVAIRSSYYLEDSQDKSYAGHFSTYLDVMENRLEVVNKVFNSSKSISKDGMRVIVQEMVDSDYSGVIFTSNPQGLLNEMVINVGYGLGDNVVENKVNTTAYYRNTHNNKGYYETAEGSPILKESIVDELFELGLTIENIYKVPMDIEFAIKDDVVYCLQARPITTLNQNKNVTLDNSNIVENFPGVVCPLTADFVKTVYCEAFKSAISKIASKKQIQEHNYIFNSMVAENNSRMYYEIDNWYKLLEFLPFSKRLLMIWEEMIGVNNVERTKANHSILSKAIVGYKFINIISKTPREMEKLDKYFKEQIEVYRDKIKKCDSKELLELYEEIKQDFGPKWGITLFNDLYAFIYMALAKKLEKRIVHGIDGIESMKPTILLNEIAKAIQEHNQDKVKDLKLEFIQLYGDRYIEELKLETKTPRVNPKLLDAMIPTNLSEKQSTLSYENKSDVKFFEKRAKMGIEGREVSRLNRSRLFGVVREIFLKIGEDFVRLNYINEVEDIFYLRHSEIEQIIKLNESNSIDSKALIEERKSILDMHSKLPTYERLIFSKEPFNKYPLNISNCKTSFKNSNLIGIPASSGVCRGEAIVIEKADLNIDTRNKIIVTESTDPGWVFLIENSSGIITERGSLLSHTSIITRELEKPSIVGISGITKLINTGDIIEINGTTGQVKIIERKG